MSRAHKRRAQDPENIILHGRIEIGALEEWFTPFERKVRRLLHLSSDQGADLEWHITPEISKQLASLKEALTIFQSGFAEEGGNFQLLRGRPEFDELWRRSDLLERRIDALEQQYTEVFQSIDTSPVVQRRHV